MASNDELTLVKDWQTTREARAYMNALFKRKKRVQFGLLEHPTIVSPILKKAPVHTCKMFLYGKSGVGKTSTVMKLSGQQVPLVHNETLGIQTTNLYWPIKRSNEETIKLLQIEVWDSGERGIRKYEHILPSCISSTDTIAFFFAYNDRSSWDELPDILSQASTKIQSHLKVVIGTKLDTPTRYVTAEEVEHFEQLYQIRVIPISNISDSDHLGGDTRDHLHDICTPLNTLAELVLNNELLKLNNTNNVDDTNSVPSLQQQPTGNRKLVNDENIDISDV